MRYISSRKIAKAPHIQAFLCLSLMFIGSLPSHASTITPTLTQTSALTQNMNATATATATQDLKTPPKEWLKEAPQNLRKQSSKLYRKKLKSADYFALLNE